MRCSLQTTWNVVLALLICYCCVVVPLEIAFERSLVAGIGDDGWEAWEAFNLGIDCFFLFDICLSFRTGYLVEGQLVRDGWMIASHYLRSGFVIDLIGSFPLNLVLTFINDDSGSTNNNNAARLNRQLRLLRIAKMNRLLRLSKLSKTLKSLEVLLRFHPSALRLLYSHEDLERGRPTLLSSLPRHR